LADGVWVFVNDPARLSSSASPSVVERPDDEKKLRVLAEELFLAKETLVIEAFILELQMMYERTCWLLEPNYPESGPNEREAVVSRVSESRSRDGSNEFAQTRMRCRCE
jgi:hypothetical protein